MIIIMKKCLWIYDVTNEKKEEEIELQDLKNSVKVCTSIEIKENLEINNSLQCSSKHRKI